MPLPYSCIIITYHLFLVVRVRFTVFLGSDKYLKRFQLIEVVLKLSKGRMAEIQW